MTAILQVDDITKDFWERDVETRVLKGISFKLQAGELVALPGQAHLNEHQVEVVVGEQLMFGNAVRNSAIHGRKFEDLNANGEFDPGEPGLGGWTIVLFDGNGKVVQERTLKSVTRKDIETDLFALPKGYKVTSLEKMMQR